MNAQVITTSGIKSITVIGRRWFHRGPGNTYHSVQILVNGLPWRNVDYRYGYGTAYEDSALALLQQEGVLPKEPHYMSACSLCEKLGIAYSAIVTDVHSKKDL